MDFITGDKFKTIADWLFAPEVKSGEAYDNLQNTLDVSLLKDNNIIYTHTFYAKQLFEIIRQVDKRVVIITHNSDQNIDDSFILPDNVIKWYAQNVNVLNPRIESIPIGLENDRWHPALHKKEKMIAKYKEGYNYKNLLYINHNVSNNPSKRKVVYDLYRGRRWVTCAEGKNGEGFDDYLDNMYNHKFMACPEGNGMDTHRTWECLYMGTIPIEKRNINNSFFEDMPILLIDQWDDITEQLLLQSWPHLFCSRNHEKLTFEYWKKKIQSSR